MPEMTPAEEDAVLQALDPEIVQINRDDLDILLWFAWRALLRRAREVG